MGDDTASALATDACSDYGSEFEFDAHALPALSDYGSDIDVDALDDSPIEVVATDAELDAERAREKQHDDPAVHSPERPALRWVHSSPVRRERASMELEYDASSRRAFSVPRSGVLPEITSPVPAHDPVEDATPLPSPLERFRTKPRKPLSVTDLVSPAWCELQYLYTLSRFGRKPATEAMRTGSRIHQVLEEQVHVTVPVQVKSKEDRFGLRIWNAIQGLRCLRETGLTRELEVWGVIEGQVVNGVIDELSFTCPDVEFEERYEMAKAAESGGTVPLGQLSIEQAFVSAGSAGSQSAPDNSAWVGVLEPDRQVYITDVKTRGVQSLPSGASLRPTWMQLMLYRRLLQSLSLNTVDAETIFARYDVAPLERFSDVFIQEAGATRSHYMELDSDASASESEMEVSELRSHPNLLSLWSLMISEYQRTVLSISDVLRAEFRYSKTGEVIGDKLTVYSADTVDAYVQEKMGWWKGTRAAKGVDIEEAFKCRNCDFAEECSWRKTKVEEATEKHRLRRRNRGKSAV